jgi:tRNA (guanine-N7-)-methyltransferase
MELVPSNIVGKIYVHFPVPWDKKPHRRVISTTFIKEARRVLKVGGTLELRTDSENYYAYSYETFIAFNKTTLHINKNKDIEVSSKYEDRWKRMQKNIYDLTMINDENSSELELNGDFIFNVKNIDLKKVLELNSQTKRFNDSFIHIERVYELKDGLMLRVSMGSFDRPEHLYVIVKQNSIRYYPDEPIKTKSNLAVHKHLNEVLNG